MRAWVAALAVLVIACDQPDPGQLPYDLDTPFDEDGAIQLVVTAPVGYRLSDVAPLCSGCRVFQRVVSEQEIRALVVGVIVDGPFVAVSVTDRRDPARFTVTIESAAGRDYALRPRGGYGVVPRR